MKSKIERIARMNGGKCHMYARNVYVISLRSNFRNMPSVMDKLEKMAAEGDIEIQIANHKSVYIAIK